MKAILLTLQILTMRPNYHGPDCDYVHVAQGPNMGCDVDFDPGLFRDLVFEPSPEIASEVI